ncbi:hypothetical protein AB1K84_19805 [Mesobacillus foraminis]|uniref:hypothetical protein n=1 Tax=Mesobacillus foraminis TaxID=279826 RepID=UPI0039A0F23C
MCGWVKWFREVLEIELRKEVVLLRQFILALIHSSKADGRAVNGIQLKRGHYTKAHPKLAEDLGYREFRWEKQYGKSTLNISSEKLMKKRIISREETRGGTLSTLLNIRKYKRMGPFILFSFDRGTVAERKENVGETNAVQKQEREKNVEKEKKDDYVLVKEKGLEEISEYNPRFRSLIRKFT